MALLSPILRSAEDSDGGSALLFYCMGCKMHHKVTVGDGEGQRWQWNKSVTAPTFTPSVLVTWFEPSDKTGEFMDGTKGQKRICHSFVRDGQIQYLGDSTHALAGKTIPLGRVSGSLDT